MRAREVAPGTQYEVDTPNAALAVTTPGDIRVDVAPDGRATTVTVRSGSVTAYGDGGSTQLTPGQQITVKGTNLQQAAANAAPAPDGFDQWAASRDAAEDRSISARYVSRDIPGYQNLDANGTWRNDASYGAIWVPNSVPADWAPYRHKVIGYGRRRGAGPGSMTHPGTSRRITMDAGHMSGRSGHGCPARSPKMGRPRLRAGSRGLGRRRRQRRRLDCRTDGRRRGDGGYRMVRARAGRAVASALRRMEPALLRSREPPYVHVD